MPIDPEIQRRTARTRFRRLLVYLLAAGVAMVAAALAYLRSYGPMSTTLVVTVVFGVLVSILLGGGLMAMGFYSSDSGVDESVAGAAVPATDDRPPDQDVAASSDDATDDQGR